MLKNTHGVVYMGELRSLAAFRDVREIAIRQSPLATTYDAADPMRYDFVARRDDDGLECHVHARVRRPRETPELDASGILALPNFHRRLNAISLCLQWHLLGRPVSGSHGRKGRFTWSADEPASPYAP